MEKKNDEENIPKRIIIIIAIIVIRRYDPRCKIHVRRTAVWNFIYPGEG